MMLCMLTFWQRLLDHEEVDNAISYILGTALDELTNLSDAATRTEDRPGQFVLRGKHEYQRDE